MKVQIYSLKSAEDATICVNAGVDFIGTSTGEKGRLKAEVDFATCREIFAAIPKDSGATKVALTIAWELDEIIETVQAVNPNIVHLSGDIADLSVEQVAVLRKLISPVKIMQAIPVSGPEAVKLALEYQSVSDYLILDTDLSGFPGIGATGATHDWAVSAEIVKRANIPVILAGGLSPNNVAEAIRSVKPWCVDSFSHTNLPDSKEKDPERVKAFVEAAKSAL